MKYLICIIMAHCIALPIFGQKLIAHYPLKSDGKDAVNQQGNLRLLGTQFSDGGTKCAGSYGDYDAGKGVAILSPRFDNLDIENFSIRVDFKVTTQGRMPVFAFDASCRLVIFALTAEGKVSLQVNNMDITKESTLAYKVNTWQTATVVVQKGGTIIAYLDAVEVARLTNTKLNIACVKDFGRKDISTVNFSNGNVFNGFWRDLRVYNGSWTPQFKDIPPPPTDTPIKPTDNPSSSTITNLGSWKTLEFAVAGKPKSSLGELSRLFFSMKSSAGNLEVVWQDASDNKVYLTRFDANMQNPQHIVLPTPAQTKLLAVTNDDKDNYYYAVFKNNQDKKTNDILTLCKADKSGRQVLQQPQSSAAADLDIWDFGYWGATMRYYDGKLAMFMARRMNKGGDGLNHQGGIAVLFDANTLKVLRNFGQTSGHSFDNFLTINKNGEFLGMDLGDNYPRGINVHKFSTTSNYINKRIVYTFKTQHGTEAQSPDGRTYPKYDEISTSQTTFYKWSNDNGTYTELGGIVEVADGYFVIFAGEPDEQGRSINNARAVSYPRLDARNLGFVKIRKDYENAQTLQEVVLSKGKSETGGFYSFGGGWSKQQNEGVVWLTKHKNPKTENVQNIKTMGLPNGNILIIYAVDTPSSWDGGKDGYQPYMMVLDAQGKTVLPATALDKKIRINRRDEIILVGKNIVLVEGANDTSSNALRLHILTLK